MKKINNILIMLLGMVVFITSCQDDTHELGRKLDKSEIQFRVEQPEELDEGGNTVILINETPETIAMWDYGTGRSNRTVDTVRFPFQGEYTIKFSALTAGGVVAMDPVTVEVTEDNFDYISDELWINLSGGPGEEKTWVLDLNEEGVSKYFDGPMYFYGTDRNVDWECENPDDEDGCWNWNPDYAGNDWLMPTGDYGTMTFNLDGGPFVTVNHNMLDARGEESGTYFLDVNQRTLALTDAGILHNEGNEDCVEDWGNARIVTLTEDVLQLAVFRQASCDGEAYLVYNFISQEYSDNWVPEDEGPQPDPNFDHGDPQKDILAVDKTTTKTWQLDTEVPYNWANLEGELLNEWNTRADIIATGWAPFGDADVENINDASISFSEDGTVVVTQDDGTVEEGTYSIDETTNLITFEGVTPAIPIADWVVASTSEENQWKILRVERSDVNDKVNGIWFGVRDTEKDEYIAYHFKLQQAGAPAEPTPEEIMMTNLAGDDSKTWQLDEQVPFDWVNLDFEFLNGFTSITDYPEWAQYNETHVEGIDEASIQFAADGTVVVTQDDGTTDDGTFTVNGATKEITFQDVKPQIPVGGAFVAEPTAENVWKIIVQERNANNEVTGIWFGKRDPEKDEYMVFHFVLQ